MKEEDEEEEIEEEQIIEIKNEKNENEDNQKKNENNNNEINNINEENKNEDKEKDKEFEIKIYEVKDKDEDNNSQLLSENNNQQPSEDKNKEEMKKKEIEEVILLIKSKIEQVKDKYKFCLQNHDIIFEILKSLENLAFEKISNSIDDNCNFLNFFKASSDIYSRFCEEIKKSNNGIMSSLEKPKMGSNLVLEAMQNTQNTLYSNLSNLSQVLKLNIIDNNRLSKVQEQSKNIESIKKSISNKYDEINKMKQKLEDKYINSYEKIFQEFLKEAENNEQDINIKSKILYNKNDFFCIFNDLKKELNNLIIETNLYIFETNNNLMKINKLFNSINNIVGDSLLIYIEQIKGIFNNEMNNNFEKIKQFYQDLKNPEENVFKLNIIFDKQEHKKKINNLLEEYYKLLNKSEEKEQFSIDSHSSFYLFLEWLAKKNPKVIELCFDDLIIKKFDVKRKGGYFGGLRDCIMTFTKQKHIIVSNKSNNTEEINKSDDIFKIYELNQTNFNHKNDNYNSFEFELVTLIKGRFMNSNETIKYDALNKDNLDEISNFFNYKDS